MVIKPLPKDPYSPVSLCVNFTEYIMFSTLSSASWLDKHTYPIFEAHDLNCSRFVWANGRAAGIGITIPVCSIGRLPLLEPLPSLPNIEWKRRQSFRNKMAEAANETSFEEFFFLI